MRYYVVMNMMQEGEEDAYATARDEAIYITRRMLNNPKCKTVTIAKQED